MEREILRAAGRDAADHDELHGSVQAGRTTRSGPSTWTSSATTAYPDPNDPESLPGRGVPARPRAVAEARGAVDPHGAGDERRQLAPVERAARRPARWRAETAQAIGARRRRHPVLPVAAVPRRAPRSSTPRCCRTRAPSTRTWRERDRPRRAARRAARPCPPRGRDARVALVFDWENWWAVEAADHPIERLDYLAVVQRWYGALHRAARAGRHRAARARRRAATPSRSRRCCTCCATRARRRSPRFVEGGGHLLAGPFTDVVDEHDQFRDGGFLTQLGRLLRRALRGLRRARRRDHRRHAASARRRARAPAGGATVGGPLRRRRPSRARLVAEVVARRRRRRSSRRSPTGSRAGSPALTRHRMRGSAKPGTSRRCPTPQDSTPSSAAWSRHPVSVPSCDGAARAASRPRAAATSSRSSTTATSRVEIAIEGTDAETGRAVGAWARHRRACLRSSHPPSSLPPRRIRRRTIGARVGAQLLTPAPLRDWRHPCPHPVCSRQPP